MGWFGSRPIQGSRTHRSFTQLDLLKCPEYSELTPRLVVIYESPEGTTPKLAHSSLRSQWAGLEVDLYRAPERIEALLNRFIEARPEPSELTPSLVVMYESPEGTTPKLAHSSLRSQWAGLEVALYRAPE